MEELQIELTALRHLVRLKNKELRTIRRLSETILQQRSEVRLPAAPSHTQHTCSVVWCGVLLGSMVHGVLLNPV
jgi:hypothetical protein